MRRIVTVVTAALATFVMAAWPAQAAPVPAGYRVTAEAHPVPGLTLTTLERDDPHQVVHVARMAPGARLALRAVLSNDAVAEDGGRLERTSALCARVRCLAAVNGDFALPGTDAPVGGMVVGGTLVRTPSPHHNQLVIGADGGIAAGTLPWRGAFVTDDLASLTVDGVNTDRGDDQLIVYTPAMGPSTRTNPHGVELVVRVEQPAPPVRLGATAAVRMVELRDGAGDTPIAPDTVVLSGHGAAAERLRASWARVEQGALSHAALLRLDAAGNLIAESIGGSPILVRDGRRWFADEATPFVRGRHPRTVVGWTPGGDVLLVTADGRQPGHALGLSLAEAADLLLALGATDALNLDGGGSTTFVEAGAVTNRPSDRLIRSASGEQIVPVPASGATVVGNVERPVVSALAIVASDGPGPDPVLAPVEHLLRPPTASVTGDRRADAASDPEYALPALVAPVGGTRVPAGLAGAAVALLVAVAMATTVSATRRRTRTA